MQFFNQRETDVSKHVFKKLLKYGPSTPDLVKCQQAGTKENNREELELDWVLAFHLMLQLIDGIGCGV